jgi:hypothetical protein
MRRGNTSLLRFVVTNLKHFLGTLALLLMVGVAVAVYSGTDIYYGDGAMAYKVGDEGPHVFRDGDHLVAQYIRGRGDTGFRIEQTVHPADQVFTAAVHFPLDGSHFEVSVSAQVASPPVVYDDGEAIVALSDIESSFNTFRDFLIIHRVIDAQLNWTFGRGHLVLVGDFVDRGASTTQVLWFIYALEQKARAQGGVVHYILGNHEIKYLQGNFQKAAAKYWFIAGMLRRQPHELYGEDSLLGQWMASKNTAERINGHLFVHGGVHPQLGSGQFSLQALNQVVRDNYRMPYYRQADADMDAMLLSTREGPSWYRGYFEDGLSQQQVEAGLKAFGAQAVVVGHTPQWRVRALYEGRVIAIDVRHPDDYRGSFPPRRSEGLLLKGGVAFRLTDDGGADPL